MADLLSCVLYAGSQVCNLSWSKNVNEIVSTHGYSQNQIVVWKYPSMSKLATLTGHTLRVLYLAVSPDGQTIVTGAGALQSIHINCRWQVCAPCDGWHVPRLFQPSASFSISPPYAWRPQSCLAT